MPTETETVTHAEVEPDATAEVENEAAEVETDKAAEVENEAAEVETDAASPASLPGEQQDDASTDSDGPVANETREEMRQD